MKKVRVALAQINPIVGDLSGNSEKILQFIKKAKSLEVDIISFPELSITGYPPEDLLHKEVFVKDIKNALGKIVNNCDGITAIVGCLDMDRKRQIYNSAAIIRDKKLRAIYHKIHLPNYGVFDEKRYFHPGKEIIMFSLGGIIFGVNICEDIWARDVVALQKKAGAKIIFNISSSPYQMGKMNLRKRFIRERVRETETYICYTNLVGGQDELVFDGGSFILGPDGKELIKAKQFEEEMIVADLIAAPVKKIKNTYINLGEIESLKRLSIKKTKTKKLDSLAEVYQALVLGTGDYVRKQGFDKVVIGLSGGIDSALTAVIACDAVGKENVIGVSMPSKYSSKGTKKDAEKLAKNLGVKFLKIGIEEILGIYLQELKDVFKGLPSNVTEENIQARIRGNILMALSNKFRWLVLTTGNKSEVSCGYCTLYGDMAGGFNVLKDVYKMLVYELSEFKNRDKEIIPKTILTRAPSAELSYDQKDQDTLPPYHILDAILKEYIEKDKSYIEIIRDKKFKPKEVRRIINMVDKSEYKRRQAPPGIKITPKAFGKDRRMPMTNRYQG